jgi:hypothetical protein
LVAYIEDFATIRDIQKKHIDERMRRLNTGPRHLHAEGRDLPPGESKHSPALTSASDLLSRGNANFIAPSSRFSKPYPRNWVAGKPGGLYALLREASRLRP